MESKQINGFWHTGLFLCFDTTKSQEMSIATYSEYG